MDSLYFHLFTSNSYFWINGRLLAIFGGQLSAPVPSPWPLIFAGLLFIMLFTLLKQIISVLKSSRLHCPIGFMVSFKITSKITSLLNLPKIKGQMYLYLSALRISLLHLTYVVFLLKKYVKYLTALINKCVIFWKVFNFTQMEVIAYCRGQKINSLINLYGKNIHNEGNIVWEVLGIILCKQFSQRWVMFQLNKLLRVSNFKVFWLYWQKN